MIHYLPIYYRLPTYLHLPSRLSPHAFLQDGLPSSACLSVYLPPYQHLSPVCLYLPLPIYLPIYQPTCLYIFLQVYLFTYLSI